VPELQRLRADHEAAVLDFERANRSYFAGSISDRGDAYFEQFADRHAELPAEREAGECAYLVLVGPADPAEIGGKPGDWFERRLAPA
jgi:ribosomal-protein-alanine N-acetyltransferase